MKKMTALLIAPFLMSFSVFATSAFGDFTGEYRMTNPDGDGEFTAKFEESGAVTMQLQGLSCEGSGTLHDHMMTAQLECTHSGLSAEENAKITVVMEIDLDSISNFQRFTAPTGITLNAAGNSSVSNAMVNFQRIEI